MNLIHRASVAIATVLIASSASAAPTEAQLCLAAKEKALSKLELCVWKAQAKAAQLGGSADTALCQTKFNEAFAKPDLKYGADCPDATAATISGLFDDHVAEVLAAFGAGGPGSGASCDLHTQNCASSTEGCYFAGGDAGTCQTAGTTPDGGTCEANNECVEGSSCFSNGSTTNCYEMCAPSAEDCTNSATHVCVLIDGSSDTGACVAP